MPGFCTAAMVPGSIPGKKKGAMTAVKIVLQKGFQVAS